MALQYIPFSEKIRTTFRAAHDFQAGGTTETLAAIGISGAIAAFALPFGPLVSTTALFGAMAAAGAGAAWLSWRMASPLRERFTLPTTCRLRSDPPPVKAFSTPGLLLGYTTDKGEPFYLPDWNLFRHLWIIGMSGMGKTVAGSLLMFQQIQRGGGLLFVDGKLDYDNINAIYQFAAWCGRAHEVKILNPGDPSLSNTYSPVFLGDAFEITSRIMALVPEDPGSDYYRGEATVAVITIVGAILAAGRRFTIEDLVILLNNSRALEQLEALLATVAAKDKEGKNLSVQPALLNLRLWLDRFRVPQDPTGRNPLSGKVDIEKIKKNMGGVSSKIAAFSSGDFGRVFNTYTPEIRLDEEITNGGIVYVALPTMSKEEAAYPFAKMLVGDVKTVCAWLQKDPKIRPKVPFMCFLDEARSYITQAWGVFFEQARSAGLFLMPAFQTLPQSSEEADVVDRVVGNATSKLFFRIGTPTTAEAVAEHIGKVKVAQRSLSQTASQGQSANTVQVDPGAIAAANSGQAEGSREAEEYLVSPRALTGLDIGEAIMLYEGRHVMNLRIPRVEIDKTFTQRIGSAMINHRRPDLAGSKLGLHLVKNAANLLSSAKSNPGGGDKPKKD
jgi:hypothetical protein